MIPLKSLISSCHILSAQTEESSLLSYYSPSLKSIIDSISVEADIGVIKGVKALYVLIPLVVAFISRIVKLHDKISDLFSIRHEFDKKHILLPIARKVGYDLSTDINKEKRNNLMYKVFYPYAGFNDPVIDAQLVRTALDNWGWFWVGIEAAFMFLLTSVIFLCMQLGGQSFAFLLISITIILLCIIQYKACISSATAEVNTICDDGNRKNEILEKFSNGQN